MSVAHVSTPIPEFQFPQPQPESDSHPDRRRERKLRRLCRRCGLRFSKSRRRTDRGTCYLYPANTTAIARGSLDELEALTQLLMEVNS